MPVDRKRTGDVEDTIFDIQCEMDAKRGLLAYNARGAIAEARRSFGMQPGFWINTA
jgi:hypothetical protein